MDSVLSPTCKTVDDVNLSRGNADNVYTNYKVRQGPKFQPLMFAATNDLLRYCSSLIVKFKKTLLQPKNVIIITEN